MGEIQSSLSKLDNAFREPFNMHHEGYKYHEIADKLGIPIGTVKSRIFQARQRLMGMLTDKNVN
jgi:RNA polymerase sigma-70 factor (ECF subfamily)